MGILSVFFTVMTIWIIGSFALLFLSPYYKGRTGKNLISDDEDYNRAIIFICPIALPSIAGSELMYCSYRHYVKLADYLEKLGKENRKGE